MAQQPEPSPQEDDLSADLRKFDAGFWASPPGSSSPALRAAVESDGSKGPSEATGRSEPQSEIIVESLAGIRPKAVRWLVKNFFPLGMLGLLCGEGGHGKSMLLLGLIAALTTGRRAFGLVYDPPPVCETLLISCEDDWAVTIVPRLVAMGADLGRVKRICGLKMKADKKGEKWLDFHLGHGPELEALLKANESIRLVVIDPAGAYIGRTGVNENRDSDLRTLLGPLSDIANRYNVAIILVKHMNKTAGVSAVQRVAGSAGWINTVRYAYMVIPDQDDSDRKFVVPIKANILPQGGLSLAYRMEPLPEDEARALLVAKWADLPEEELVELAKQLFRQHWEEPVKVDPNQAIATKRPGGREEKVAKCAEFIRVYLGEFAHPDAELEAAALKAGFSKSAFLGAKKRLRTEDPAEPNRLSSKPAGKAGAWWNWIGPQSERKPDRPGAIDPAEEQRAGDWLRATLSSAGPGAVFRESEMAEAARDALLDMESVKRCEGIVYERFPNADGYNVWRLLPPVIVD